MRKNKNFIDRLIIPAIWMSAILYIMQIWGVIKFPVWALAIPIIVASGLIIPILLFASVVALIFKPRDEENPRGTDRHTIH